LNSSRASFSLLLGREVGEVDVHLLHLALGVLDGVGEDVDPQDHQPQHA